MATFIDLKWRFTRYLSSWFRKKIWLYCVTRFSSKSLNQFFYTRPGWMNCEKIWCESLFLVFWFGGPFGQKKRFNANVFFVINTARNHHGEACFGACLGACFRHLSWFNQVAAKRFSCVPLASKCHKSQATRPCSKTRRAELPLEGCGLRNLLGNWICCATH